MAIEIAYLLLALAAACSCLDGGFGGAGDPSGTDPGIRLGLTPPSRNDPVPKIEPLALIRPGFNTIGAGPRRPGPGNLPKGRFGIQVRVRPGAGFIPRNLPPVRIRHPVIPRPGFPGRLPGVAIDTIDIGHLPGNVPPGGISRPWPVGNVPRHLPPARYPFNPGWDQRGHDPFRPPGMNNDPFNNGPYYRNPQMMPRPGRNFGPSGPLPRPPIQRRPDLNQIHNRSRDDNDNEKDLSKGTVVVSVVAVNKTAIGSVLANVTITVVPKEGDNKETLKLDTQQHLNTAQSIVDEILNKHKDEEKKSKKTSKNLEDVLNKLVLAKG